MKTRLLTAKEWNNENLEDSMQTCMARISKCVGVATHDFKNKNENYNYTLDCILRHLKQLELKELKLVNVSDIDSKEKFVIAMTMGSKDLYAENYNANICRLIARIKDLLPNLSEKEKIILSPLEFIFSREDEIIILSKANGTNYVTPYHELLAFDLMCFMQKENALDKFNITIIDSLLIELKVNYLRTYNIESNYFLTLKITKQDLNAIEELALESILKKVNIFVSLRSFKLVREELDCNYISIVCSDDKTIKTNDILDKYFVDKNFVSDKL